MDDSSKLDHHTFAGALGLTFVAETSRCCPAQVGCMLFIPCQRSCAVHAIWLKEPSWILKEPKPDVRTGLFKNNPCWVAVSETVSIDQVEAAIGNLLPQEAHESRITNFIQAVLLSACLGRLRSFSSSFLSARLSVRLSVRLTLCYTFLF
jgi:hypothetical protein